MSDKFLMDGHKLYWHLDRVNDWLNNEKIAPLHIDVGLSKGCNIHCEYCFGIMQGNLYKKGQTTYFPKTPLINYVKDAGKAGVKSMAFIGEGEPTLNPYVYDAIVQGKKAGVDISLGTNGVMLDTSKKGEEALEYLSWIRFNLSAATNNDYKRIHRSLDFDKVIGNIKFCVKIKKIKKLTITIGLQMVLTPNNVNQVVPLAKLGKKIGVDYLVVKQCSDSIKNDLGIYEKLGEYEKYKDLLTEAESIGNESYKVIVKWNKISNKGERNYNNCFGVPFLLYSSGDGKLYPCGAMFGNEEWILGDLIKSSFTEIINSDRYWNIVNKVAKKIDVKKQCYSNCRTHNINEFLWKLKHPPEHINFI